MLQEKDPHQNEAAAVARESLDECLACLQKVANDSQDGLIVTNRQGQILLFSDVSASLFGYEPIEILGQNMAILMHEPYRSRHDQYVATYRETGKGKILGIGQRELPARHKNGSVIPIELSVSEVDCNGRKLFIGLCRDISARMERERALREAHEKLAASFECLEQANSELAEHQRKLAALNDSLKNARDEAQSANRAKSDFLALMSHELRTPLNGIMGMAQVLANTKLDDDQRRHLDVIGQASETLLVLLNDLLDLAKAESGRMTLEPRPTVLSSFVQQIAEHWNSRSALKGIDFEMTVADDLPKVAMLDPVRVKQVLDNLLSNALKFTEKGKVSFGVQTENRDGQAILRFDVFDTGIGIPAMHQGKIFESFTQADSSITRRFGGTGLGLAICKKLVSQMSGEITLQSTVGSGTQFAVRCPCHPVEDGRAILPANPPASAPSQTNTGKRLNILVAEDNAINQKVIAAVLGSLNYDFSIAANGREAIEMLEDEQFDLVLMDMHMPVMDGLAATRAIRARADQLGEIPIIGLTASAMDKDRESCLAAGMSAFVAKPFGLRELSAAMAGFERQAAERHGSDGIGT
ncbi:MAG: ATP-binding protein [Rhizomicrobium sp.]